MPPPRAIIPFSLELNDAAEARQSAAEATIRKTETATTIRRMGDLLLDTIGAPPLEPHRRKSYHDPAAPDQLAPGGDSSTPSPITLRTPSSRISFPSTRAVNPVAFLGIVKCRPIWR